jgi:hypothetical protein
MDAYRYPPRRTHSPLLEWLIGLARRWTGTAAALPAAIPCRRHRLMLAVDQKKSLHRVRRKRTPPTGGSHTPVQAVSEPTYFGHFG